MSVVISHVVTKSGDRGTTRLAGGEVLDKDDVRIEAYGTIDELNAVLGVCVEETPDDPADELGTRLRRVQNELFDLGGELATLPEDRHPKQALLGDADVERLEREIEHTNAGLPALRSFVLPGGGRLAASLHLARTTCRRAERRLVTLHKAAPQRGEILRYVNRLGDWLFVMSRRAAIARGGEILWRPGGAASSEES